LGPLSGCSRLQGQKADANSADMCNPVDAPGKVAELARRPQATGPRQLRPQDDNEMYPFAGDAHLNILGCHRKRTRDTRNQNISRCALALRVQLPIYMHRMGCVACASCTTGAEKPLLTRPPSVPSVSTMPRPSSMGDASFTRVHESRLNDFHSPHYFYSSPCCALSTRAKTASSLAGTFNQTNDHETRDQKNAKGRPPKTRDLDVPAERGRENAREIYEHRVANGRNLTVQSDEEDREKYKCMSLLTTEQQPRQQNGIKLA
jgi:hypothetical protein